MIEKETPNATPIENPPSIPENNNNVIIPKPGTIYSEYICQGSDGNYYVRNNGVWVKVDSGKENYTTLDCSTNPLCPIANKGYKYVVSVSGRFGGNSGPEVNVGDVIICYADNKTEREWNGNTGTPDTNFVIVESNQPEIPLPNKENSNSFYLYCNHQQSVYITENANVDPVGLIRAQPNDTDITITLNNLSSISNLQKGSFEFNVLNQGSKNITLISSINDDLVDFMENVFSSITITTASYAKFLCYFGQDGRGKIMQII